MTTTKKSRTAPTTTTTPATVNVTLARINHGDTQVHLTGCAHLRKAHDADWTADVTSIDDVTFEMYGATLVATDTYPGDRDDEEAYRAYTLAHFEAPEIAPCARKALAVKRPRKAAAPAPQAPSSTDLSRPGYAVRWPKGAVDLLQRQEGVDGPAWLVLCKAHNVTTPAETGKAGDALATKAARPAWCPGCAAAAAPAPAAAPEAPARKGRGVKALPATVTGELAATGRRTRKAAK